MTPLNTAYRLGTLQAMADFEKQAEPALGDPNYWQGGEEAMQQPPQPQTVEEAVQLLPGGTFQGLQSKVTPDGQKTTTVKVSPDALMEPDGLSSMFQTGEGAKIEIESPQEAPGAGATAVPGPGGAPPPMGPEGGAPPPGGAPDPLTGAPQ